MSTASDLVFAGDNENFNAFAARTGKNLWHYPTGSPIWGAAPMTYRLDGRHQVIMAPGRRGSRLRRRRTSDRRRAVKISLNRPLKPAVPCVVAK